MTVAEPAVSKSPAKPIVKFVHKHRLVCDYYSQGLSSRSISKALLKDHGIVMDFTVVCRTLRNPKAKAYIEELSQRHMVRAEALLGKTVDRIAKTLRSGSNDEATKAGRLQLELTRRIGIRATDGAEKQGEGDRLLTLSERLVGLLEQQRGRANGQIIDGEFRDATGSGAGFPTGDDSPGAGSSEAQPEVHPG